MSPARRPVRAFAFFALLVLVVAGRPAMGFAADLSTPRGHRLAVNGISLYYEESGQGEPLVLLHAWGWSGKQWGKMLPGLERNFRVINVDLRGHGRSTGWQRDDFRFEVAARDVLALADQLHLQQFRLMGASAGAMTALHIAVQAPARVGGMVLVGASAFVPDSLRHRPDVASPHCADASDDDLRDGRAFNEGGDDQTRRLGVVFCDWMRHDTEDVRARLHTVPARTLFVHGDHDRYFPVSTAALAAESMPNGYLWVYPDDGHLPPFNLDDPAPFVERAVAFLKGQWGTRPPR